MNSNVFKPKFQTDEDDDMIIDDEEDVYETLPNNFIKRIEFWDLARNGYIFTHLTEKEFHFDYCPMTPYRSSSGEYDGGPAIHKNISSQEFTAAEHILQDLRSRIQDHSDQAYMGTFLLKEISNQSSNKFLLKGLSTASGNNLSNVLKTWHKQFSK